MYVPDVSDKIYKVCDFFFLGSYFSKLVKLNSLPSFNINFIRMIQQAKYFFKCTDIGKTVK